MLRGLEEVHQIYILLSDTESVIKIKVSSLYSITIHMVDGSFNVSEISYDEIKQIMNELATTEAWTNV